MSEMYPTTPVNHFREALERENAREARKSARSHARYHALRSAGLCADCGNPSKPAYCPDCALARKIKKVAA